MQGEAEQWRQPECENEQSRDPSSGAGSSSLDSAAKAKSKTCRHWTGIEEGTFDMLDKEMPLLRELAERAGGQAQLEKALAGLPAAVKEDPISLLDQLSVIFKLTDAEWTVLACNFWLVSGHCAVVMETSLFGGLHFVRGTHMRSPYWTFKWLQHKQIKSCFPPCSAQVLDALSKGSVKALSIVAMLTIQPKAWSRVCRQVLCLCVRERESERARERS